MSYLQDEYERESEFRSDQVEKEPVNEAGRAVAMCVLLALLGSGSAFLWHYYGGATIALVASKPEATSTLMVTLQGLQQSQQGVAGEIQRNQEMLQAQQADIKRLSDEISHLAAKLDSLQNSTGEAQASARPPVQRTLPKKPPPKRVVHEPAAPIHLSPAPEEKQ